MRPAGGEQPFERHNRGTLPARFFPFFCFGPDRNGRRLNRRFLPGVSTGTSSIPPPGIISRRKIRATDKHALPKLAETFFLRKRLFAGALHNALTFQKAARTGDHRRSYGVKTAPVLYGSALRGMEAVDARRQGVCPGADGLDRFKFVN